MAHIQIDETLSGMRSLLAYRPAIAPPLTTLMELLMRSDQGLSKGERELMAAFVSLLNGCVGCHQIHGEVAQCFFEDDETLVEKVKQSYENAPISDKLKALLGIASSVQKGGKFVKKQQIEKAKSEGASDAEIHDTVLISSLFCLFNKYIDGLGIVSKDTPETLKARAKMIATFGYSH